MPASQHTTYLAWAGCLINIIQKVYIPYYPIITMANEDTQATPETTDEAAVETEEIEEGLAFPRARVVRILKEEIKDRQIRSVVKDAINVWLGDLLRKLAKEMVKSPYGSIGLSDFQRATKPYDMIEDIVKDQERLELSCEKLKIDSDAILREMKRFFATIKGKEQSEIN